MLIGNETAIENRFMGHEFCWLKTGLKVDTKKVSIDYSYSTNYGGEEKLIGSNSGVIVG